MKRLLLLCAILCAATAHAEDLAEGFAKPPTWARPWFYWFTLSGNLTKEGITADLEAMARVGIGGVLYMEVDQGAPKGKADFAGPLWRELFAHSCHEAHRLGLEISMNNDAGWCGSGGPWIPPELSMQKVVWSETIVEGGRPFAGALPQPQTTNQFYRDIAVLAMPAPPDDQFRVKDIEAKASFRAKNFAHSSSRFPDAPHTAVIPRDEIQDVSAKLDAAGKLTWDVPAGKWLVIRFGHTTTGVNNKPAPDSGRGLECDKFSKEAVAVHYTNLVGRLVAENQAVTGAGRVLVATHIDSWEVGSQNWTPKMREEFWKRRGYDLLSYLPAFTGRVIGSAEVTERFLWDLRQTVSDLIVENYAGELRRLAHQDGLRLSIEAYGGAPVEEMAYGGQADEPMSEFWSWYFRGVRLGAANTCFAMSSAAHTYGKRIHGAEAFTATAREKWQGHPGNIKDLGDWAFCEGVNRFVFHRYAAQPWTNVAPGMAMGPWGLHYERTQPWWEQSRAWHEYLARCQYLLQQGLFVADVLYLQPEGVQGRWTAPAGAEIAQHIRGGYNYDGCSPEVVLTRLAVKDGRLVLPDGMSYRALVLPDTETMTPRLLRKITELAAAGATVIGATTPPVKSASLADLGAGDTEVKQLAAELWPKIITGKTPAEVLKERGVKPDFSATPMLRYIHRTIGDAEVYFVANPESFDVAASATFRVTGKLPELWQPDTGQIAPALAFQERDGVTSVPLRLESCGSLFVVFRKPTARVDTIVSALRNGKTVWSSAVLTDETLAPKPRPGGRNSRKRAREAEASATGAIEALSFDVSRGEIWQSGDYSLTTASGKTRQLTVALPASQEIVGPWDVAFEPKWGGPARVEFGKLVDWSQHPAAGIKYYSGAATYRTTFSSKKVKAYLDLGRVEIAAEVTLNGKTLGTLWKPPYRVDISDALQDGANTLEVKVVNLWINRLIGDEQLAEDCDRNADGTLKSWPQWLLDGKSSPTSRFTFSTWKLWKKDDPLVASGLIGPVRVLPFECFPVN